MSAARGASSSAAPAGAQRRGPLTGLRIVEFAGLGPGPFAAMMLADMGADVVRVGRRGVPGMERGPTVRGRRSVDVDLKDPAEVAQVRALAGAADVVIEGFRPGVMERLGLGPEVLLADNPRLVYGRMTGWGQSGPLAERAGHDIDYIAITGALASMGHAGQAPAIPLNLVGDYGGGALYLVAGILAAYIEALGSGRGQVVDAAICDGTVSLMTLFQHLRHEGQWRDERGANMLDTGAHYYNTYACRDGRYLAVGAIEPQFYAILRDKAGWSDPEFDRQNDRSHWPSLKEKAAAMFRTRDRDEWVKILAGSDACGAPVLTLEEAERDPHLVAREAFVELDGVRQAAPAPRFSRTPSQARSSRAHDSVDEILSDWNAAAPGA